MTASALPQITKERITLHTRPGTLPGCAIEHIVQEGACLLSCRLQCHCWNPVIEHD